MRSCTVLLLPAALLFLATPPSAQETPEAPRRTLAELEAAFAAQREKLYAGEGHPTAEQEAELLRRHEGELAAFVAREAQGDDRWNGRLMLADLRTLMRNAEGATDALEGIDPAAAPGLVLLAAADMAARLDQRPLRDRFVAAALGKDAPFEERMAMGRVLMTLLLEVERGEAIFREALEAAGDDEQRARVRWHRAEAIREREDLPENSYYKELEELHRDLPDTYYGGVARDRCAASQFTIGAPAIPFAAATVAGQPVSLRQYAGKALVLAFWTVQDPRARQLVEALQALDRQHGDDLAVLGVSVDPDPLAFRAAAGELGADFPQVCDGRGWQADLALRYHVEAAPTLIVIDRAGKIAGLNLHVDTRDAREGLRAAIELALQPAK